MEICFPQFIVILYNTSELARVWLYSNCITKAFWLFVTSYKLNNFILHFLLLCLHFCLYFFLVLVACYLVLVACYFFSDH